MKFPRILAAGIVSLAPGLAAARPSPACPMEKGAPKPADCPMAADAPSGGHLHDLGATKGWAFRRRRRRITSGSALTEARSR
jgi:hypothetical protein